MSKTEIVGKVERFLREHAPITEECHAVYLMVELRKLIDEEASPSPYKILRFYADWTVHSRKDRVTSEMKRVITDVFEAAASEIRTRHTLLPNRDAIRAFAYMDALRDDVVALLAEHGIADTMTMPKANWLAFVQRLVKVLEGQPIMTPTEDVETVCFETAREGCVIGRIVFREPIDGFPYYDYMNAY